MEDENVSPLTPDERALYVENVRDAIRIVEGYPGEPDFMVPLLRGLNGLADKLEAEPEPTWRQQDGGEVGDEPLRFTIRWDHVTHSYRVSVPNLSGSLQVVPADAYDDMRRERDEAREALRELRDAAVLAREKSWMDDALNRRFREAINNAAVPLEGVERTHTLVPNEAAEWASEIAEELADEHGQHDNPDSPLMRMSRAFAASARGERVEWPS
jgi:hypothetical protein